jgi:protein gp37
MHPDWARSIRDQCQAAEVAFFFKQWGEWRPDWKDAKFGDRAIALGIDGRQHTHGPMAASDALMHRLGKKAAGRELDGVVWDQFPNGAGMTCQSSQEAPE